jgi:transposase-like protein
VSARRPWSPEVRAEALRLHAEGHSYAQITARTGVPRATISAWQSDPDGSKARARKESYRGTCAECGAPTTGALRPSDVENLAGQDTGRDHLSHSALNTLLACRRRYFYDKVERLELIEGPRALGMGKAFQKAIEHQDPQAGVTALRDQAPAFRDQDAEDKLRIEEATVRAAAASTSPSGRAPPPSNARSSTWSGSATRGPATTPAPSTCSATPTG